MADLKAERLFSQRMKSAWMVVGITIDEVKVSDNESSYVQLRDAFRDA